jgi:hypothetical protein
MKKILLTNKCYKGYHSATEEEKCKMLSKAFNEIPFFEKSYLDTAKYLSEFEIYKYNDMMSLDLREKFFNIRNIGNCTLYSKKNTPVYYKEFKVFLSKEFHPIGNRKIYESSPNYLKKHKKEVTEGDKRAAVSMLDGLTESNEIATKKTNNNPITVEECVVRLQELGYSGMIQREQKKLVLKIFGFEKYRKKIVERLKIM